MYVGALDVMGSPFFRMYLFCSVPRPNGPQGPDLVATSDSAPNDAGSYAAAILACGSGVTKEDIIRLFDLLPKEVPSRGGSSNDACSFSTCEGRSARPPR